MCQPDRHGLNQAMRSASMRMLELMSSRRDQPTTWRMNRSITTVRNNQSSPVAIYVMSPTHTRSGSVTVNSRLSRFGEMVRSNKKAQLMARSTGLI